MGVRWDLDWVKLHILIHGKVGIGLGWSWCAILVTWMEVTCDLEWGETPNSAPGWRWDVTWMEVRFESSDLDTDDTVHRWGKLQEFGDLGASEAGIGWKEDVHFDILTLGPEFSWETTQMEKRDKSWSLAGGEMQILRLGWVWDGTWIELRQPSWDLNPL